MRLRIAIAWAVGAGLVVACSSPGAAVTGAPESLSGAITFEPSSFDCSPERSAFVSSNATLPASVKNGDRPGLRWVLDGAEIDFGSGPLSKPNFLPQSDGTWLFTDRTFAAYLCLNHIGTGIGQGPDSIGPHTIQVQDAGGTVLAQGAFTVTDESGSAPIATTAPSAPSAATATATAPSAAPSQVATPSAVATPTTPPPGGPATALDPCLAVTPAELETILGVAMGQGQPTSNDPSEDFYPKGTANCVFRDTYFNSNPYVDVKIGLLGDFPPDKVCHPDPSATSTAVSLGDEACWVAGNNPHLSELRAVKGGSMVAVTVFIPESLAEHEEATFKVAEIIVGRL